MPRINIFTDVASLQAMMQATLRGARVILRQRNAWRDVAVESARDVAGLQFSLGVSCRENKKLRRELHDLRNDAAGWRYKLAIAERKLKAAGL